MGEESTLLFVLEAVLELLKVPQVTFGTQNLISICFRAFGKALIPALTFGGRPTHCIEKALPVACGAFQSVDQGLGLPVFVTAQRAALACLARLLRRSSSP